MTLKNKESVGPDNILWEMKKEKISGKEEGHLHQAAKSERPQGLQQLSKDHVPIIA